MTEYRIFARTSPPKSPRRSQVIDQDGNEVHAGGYAGPGGFGQWSQPSGGFDFSTLAGTIGNMSFGKLSREQRFARLDALARLMDVAFIVPGTNIRYGIDGLIGLVPVVGDLLTTAMSLWIVHEARSLGAPRHVIARMLGNVALDGVVGMVPFAGDAFDVMFRANMRNMRILKRWMDKQPRQS